MGGGPLQIVATVLIMAIGISIILYTLFRKSPAAAVAEETPVDETPDTEGGAIDESDAASADAKEADGAGDTE